MFRRNYGLTVCASILHPRDWHCPIWMRLGRSCWRRRLNGVGKLMHKYDSKLKFIVWAANSWFNRVPEVELKRPWGRSSQLWPMTLNKEFLPSPKSWRVLMVLWRYIHRTQYSSSCWSRFSCVRLSNIRSRKFNYECQLFPPRYQRWPRQKQNVMPQM